MSLADKLEEKEKINLVLGDYFLKNTGMPSRTVLSNLFYMNFPIERREMLIDRNSFFNVSQGFMDFGIGNRGTLVNSILQHYMGDSDKVSKFKKFIFSNRVDSIISLDYDMMLEKYCGEYINKISFQGVEGKKNNKIKYYKCFGDIETPNELIISGQDFRKFMMLPYYKKYIERLKKEFVEKKTVFFGCDLENSDLLEFFTFLFKSLDARELKQIYFITGEKEYSEKSLEFLKKFDIQILSDELHTFKEKNIDFQEKKIEKKPEELEQLEIFQENKIFQESKIALENSIGEEECEKLILKTGFTVETAPELQFNSLHLYKNPIKFNNIPELSDEKIFLKNDNPYIKLGDEQIFGTKLRITTSKIGKFLEIKSREFKIKISVALDRSGEIFLERDYLEYEIFSNTTPQRLKIIIEFFISLFSGGSLLVEVDKIKGELNLHNRLQMLKFQIMRESYSNYDFVSESSLIAEEKKFYNSSLTYYENYLLWNYLKNTPIETWMNLQLDSPIEPGKYKEIILEREHSIKLRSGQGKLLEKIIVSEISENGKTIQLMKKRIKIEIEIKTEDV